MSSQLKIETNRRNAQRSTGPRTDAGKAAASLNGATHGLASSRAIVLPEENRQEFQELLDGFRSQYQPQNPALAPPPHHPHRNRPHHRPP
ncbi:MAG: hypothetical protein AAB403_06110, partial [Planctomycetota bacterium]